MSSIPTSSHSQSDRLRVVVVGAGHLGRFHLEKINRAGDLAQLVAIVETDPDRRAEMKNRWEVETVACLTDVKSPTDAAIVAVPTSDHLAVAGAAMDRQWHVLVEKPMAPTLADANKMAHQAEEQHLILQVGHTERFNPAITAALEVADRPRYIDAERLGPFSGRSTDVDVILDLMIHELDLVGHLIPAALEEVRAIGVPLITHDVDMAAVRLQFTDGAVAQLSAGRASLEPSRKIRLFTLERYVSIDCAQREVKSVRRLPPDPSSPWPQIVGEEVIVPAGDSLELQDRHFLTCIRSGDRPRVDARAGVRALELAEAVKEALRIPVPKELFDPS